MFAVADNIFFTTDVGNPNSCCKCIARSVRFPGPTFTQSADVAVWSFNFSLKCCDPLTDIAGSALYFLFGSILPVAPKAIKSDPSKSGVDAVPVGIPCVFKNSWLTAWIFTSDCLLSILPSAPRTLFNGLAPYNLETSLPALDLKNLDEEKSEYPYPPGLAPGVENALNPLVLWWPLLLIVTPLEAPTAIILFLRLAITPPRFLFCTGTIIAWPSLRALIPSGSCCAIPFLITNSPGVSIAGTVSVFPNPGTWSPLLKNTFPPMLNLFGLVVSIEYGAPKVLTPRAPAILLIRPLFLGLVSSFMLAFPVTGSNAGWSTIGSWVKLIVLPCAVAIPVAAWPIIASICWFNAIILALAWSTFILDAWSSATICADSAAANEVILDISGSSAWYESDNEVVIKPVAAISFLSNAISCCDCIANAPVIEWNLAASSATIPVETPRIALAPATFGKSPDIYICGLLLIFWLTNGAPGTTPNIVCADFSSAVILLNGFKWEKDLVSLSLIKGWFGTTSLPPPTTVFPATVEITGLADIVPELAFLLNSSNSKFKLASACPKIFAALASL